MVSIRTAQLAALRELPEDFVVQTVGRLRSRLPRHVALRGEPSTRALVERTIVWGHRHGLSTAPTLSELAALTLEFGECFCNSPDQTTALEILAHPGLPGELKLNVVRDHLRARTRGRTLAPEAS